MNTVNIKKLSLGLLAGILLAGCSQSKYENVHQAVTVNVRNHLALAVDPSFTKVAIMPFANSAREAHADTMARRSFYGNLVSYRNWNVQPISETDTRLATISKREAQEGNAKGVGAVLGVDLVVYGEVKEHTHSYFGIYAYNSVTARIAAYNAKNGDKVWEAEDFRDSLVMGISLIYMYQKEFMWGRELADRYDELFRDMMQQFPLCTYKK